MKPILDSLPEDMIFITNCDSLKVKAQTLPSRYTDKYIAITQRKVLDILKISDYCISNHSLVSYIDAPRCILQYEESIFEGQAPYFLKSPCIEYGTGIEEQIVRFLGN